MRLTFCTGSLGASPHNDLPAPIRRIGPSGRIHFVHAHNVRVTGDRRFQETPHPAAYGDVDMTAVLRALHEVGFAGPLRPWEALAALNGEERINNGLPQRRGGRGA